MIILIFSMIFVLMVLLIMGLFNIKQLNIKLSDPQPFKHFKFKRDLTHSLAMFKSQEIYQRVIQPYQIGLIAIAIASGLDLVLLQNPQLRGFGVF
ncbi:MAG: hypothetical protein HC920_07910 [Oscillatoriales cyanobacterium SM2_3_0]|nr:hypothetical protein [Oscillatoriales cyanobacterium SM2_3_0]